METPGLDPLIAFAHRKVDIAVECRNCKRRAVFVPAESPTALQPSAPTCGSCAATSRHEKVVTGGDFWRMFGTATIPLHRARKRLRCEQCQRKGPKVAPTAAK
jgi:hypothetical protein